MHQTGRHHYKQAEPFSAISGAPSLSEEAVTTNFAVSCLLGVLEQASSEYYMNTAKKTISASNHWKILSVPKAHEFQCLLANKTQVVINAA